MRLSAPTGIHVVKKEEKEEKLRAFVEMRLVDRLTSEEPAAGATISVIARSLDSPVVRALAQLADSLDRAGLHLAAIVADEPTATDAKRAALFSSLTLFADPRFLEAHEQLVIDSTTTWIGDCMRREPNKRDAYERFAVDCADTAAWARRTYDRLLAHAGPCQPAAPAEPLLS
jgi:hypothetical protein